MDEISSVMSNLSISIQTQNFYDFASKLSAFNDSLNLLIVMATVFFIWLPGIYLKNQNA